MKDTEKIVDIHDKILQFFDVICGHSHKLRIDLNVGSIGGPLDGDNRASYAYLEMDNKGDIKIQIKRVAYNYQKMINKLDELQPPFYKPIILSLKYGDIM